MADAYRSPSERDDAEEVTQPSVRFPELLPHVPIVPLWRALVALVLLTDEGWTA